MPFPLAHPAVVLPLRKIPWLSLSAMMIGCLTPDVSYGIRNGSMTRFAHSMAGSFLFCLPVGLLAYVMFRIIREPLAALLPSPHRQVLTALCRGRRHSWISIIVSIWIGACSHVLLDLLTHESKLILPYLVGAHDRIAAIELEGRRFSRILWFALSFAGLTALAVSYVLLLRKHTGSWALIDRRELGRTALWLAAILVPLLVILFGTENPVRFWPWRYRLQRFLYTTMAWYLVVMVALTVSVGLMLRLAQILNQGRLRRRNSG
jgi:hypothetical protein